MLAKRIIVGAFAVGFLLALPFLTSGKKDLFRDTPAGFLTTTASTTALVQAN